MAVRPISLLAAILVLALPSVAFASGKDVIADCMDHGGVLTQKFTQAEYAQALASLPADSDAYSDCRDVIKQARLAQATHKNDPGSGAATNTASKISKRKKAKIKHKLDGKNLVNAAPLQIGSAVVKPGSLNSSSTIPPPLIAVIVLTVLGAVCAAAIAIRRIVLDRRNG